MPGHELYWELQALLKRHGLVRVKRKSGKEEVEVWIYPQDGLRLETRASSISEDEVRKALEEKE